MQASERKELVSAVGEALEQVVLPRLASIEDTLEKHSEMLEDHGRRLGRIEDTLEKHSEMLEDHGRRLDNIDRKLSATVTITDRQSQRLDRLEDQTNLPPLEPVKASL